ncbi:MAG: DUF4340 domain-containing protein, partial [Defluviitaleaceae bacterium]|nr:DUF4340 domain-containing protein [Defluviitaleaceae bacterium]
IEPYPGMDLDIQGISDSILSPLGALQIGNLVEFHAENPADFGFDNPLLEFEFVSVPGHGLMDTFLVFGDIFEQDGIDYIYVRFADRPHVFKTQLWQIDSLLDIHIFDILQRFIALIDIRDVERVIIDSAENSFEMVMNHSGDFSELDPTINDMPIEERVFRIAYRTLISTSADADIPLFAPEGEPAVTITFYRIDNPDTELRFFEFDVNFFAVSVDGEDAWFVSGRRQIDLLFSHLHELLAD